MKTTKLTQKIAAIFAAATMMIAAVTVSASAETKYMISGDEFRAAYSQTGEKTINYVTFKNIENYELQFCFKLNSGITKTYTAFSTHLKAPTSYIPMQDMLDKLKITADDIEFITVSGISSDNVERMSFSLTDNTKVTTVAFAGAGSSVETPAAAAEEEVTAMPHAAAPEKEAAPAALQASVSADKNPSTGVADITVPLILAAVFGTAVIGFGIAGAKKRK